MRKNLNSGFTLLELLVVVAIIGILTAVVLASTSTSRARGDNTSIKNNMKSISQQAELYYLNNNNSYGTATYNAIGDLDVCSPVANTTLFNDPIIASAMEEIKKRNGNVEFSCAASSSMYILQAKLKIPDGANNFWCIDSKNKIKANNGLAGIGVGVNDFCP